MPSRKIILVFNKGIHFRFSGKATSQLSIKQVSHDFTCFVSGILLVVHIVPIFVVPSKL